MTRDLAGLADVVVLSVKTVMGPMQAGIAVFQERLSGFEARLLGLSAYEQALTEIRERVVIVETKAEVPSAAPVVVDLGPVLERLAAAEARLAVLGDLRDRVVTVETKAAQPAPVSVPDPAIRDLQFRLTSLEAIEPATVPEIVDVSARVKALEARPDVQPVPDIPPVDLGPVLERLSVAEARLAILADIRDRLVAVETKTTVPVDFSDVHQRVADVKALSDVAALRANLDITQIRERLSAIEQRLQDDSLTKEFTELHERVAVMEVRAQVPGPAGKDGAPGLNGTDGIPGKDGAPGKDGLAGLSFEGVYQEGKSYDFGNLVTWAGSSWHCNELTTTKPGDGSKSWTLMVKRGRDGRDGHDAPGALPVISIRGTGESTVATSTGGKR